MGILEENIKTIDDLKKVLNGQKTKEPGRTRIT